MQKKVIDFRPKVDLSIIVISLSTEKYKTKIYLEKLLKSIRPAIKNISYEFILINNSTIDDGTYKLAKEYVRNLVYVERKGVFSFCDNNNLGIKKAHGKYVLFLNNDTELIDSNIFVEMINYLNNNEGVGAISPSLMNSDRKTLQASGGYFPNLTRVFLWMTLLDNLPFIEVVFNSYHPNKDYYNKKHDQDWVTGAFYMARKDNLDKVGGFDEDYGAYVEEVDLSYKIKKLGFRIVYDPKWKVVHIGGMSYGSESQIIQEFINLKLFYKKHYPKWQLPVLNLIIKLGCILRMIVFSIFKPNLAKIYAKAFKTV